MTAADGSGPARRSRAAGAGHRTAIRMVALATVAHMLRSPRFYQRVITVAIAVRALGQIGQEDQVSTMTRLTDWDRRQIQRLERKAKRQGRAIRGAGQMVRSGEPRIWRPRRTGPDDHLLACDPLPPVPDAGSWHGR
jgi:hypothetical protein